MQTFKEYLIELMVDVDPNDAPSSIMKTKKALRNPDQAAKKSIIDNRDEANSIKQNQDDPNKAKKLRINQMKQRLAADEQRLSNDEQRQTKQAGV